ncbi:MAG: right-handed parallel beta-helix repeat-containing protein [Phycisphaerales bacterium]|nr:right-handed parallel beta-helix repeat-containing protein [Phycisphaerales bacterium]
MRSRKILGALMMFSMLSPGAVRQSVAATITVPGDQPTIQDAIDNASDGDMILVADGSFIENLVIDVPNLTLLSENGPDASQLVHAPGPATPIVLIAAPGVRIGGPGQGFTITHKDSAAQKLVEIDSPQVGQPNAFDAGALILEGNRFLADAAAAAIHSNGALADVEVIIAANRFERLATAASSFSDAIYFADSSFNGGSSTPFHSADVEIRDNVFALFSNSAVHVQGNTHSSALLIRNNEMFGLTGGASYGVYVSDAIDEFSAMEISNNTIDDVGEGVYVDYLQDGSTLTVADNTVTNFHDVGLNVRSVYYGSDVVLSGNALGGDSTADYGIHHYYLDEGCTLRIEDNTISGVDYAGIYSEYSYYTQTFSMLNNEIVTNNADYGIYVYSHDATNFECSGNQVSGYNGDGFYLWSLSYGCNANVSDNTLTGNGARNGIYVGDAISEGSELTLSGNTISSFSENGIYANDMTNGASLTIANNVVTASPGGTGTYGIQTSNLENGSLIQIAGNTIDLNGSDKDGINAYYVASGSDVTVMDNRVRNYRRAGLFVDDYVEYGSTFTVTNNVFEADETSGSQYGICFNDYVEYGSEALITGNTATGFTEAGIYVYAIYEGSDLVCDNNVVTGADDGATYGIYVYDFEYGSLASSISGNTISGMRDSAGSAYGIYIDYTYEGCFVDMLNNSITAHTDGAARGIQIDYHEYGSILNIASNSVSGFTEASLAVDGIDNGAIVNVNRNLFEGADHGLIFSTVEYGSTVNIADNTMDAFKVAAVLVDSRIYSSEFRVERNSLSGNDAACGVNMTAEISRASNVLINDNCIGGVVTGATVETILDTAQMSLRGNDFSTVTGDAIENVAGDADHPVDAEQNFLDGAGVSGNVIVDPELNSPPDLDGDGVPNCADLCSDTPDGTPVDSDGCPLFGGPPDNGTGDPDQNGCGAGGATGGMLLPFSLIGARSRRRHTPRKRAQPKE